MSSTLTGPAVTDAALATELAPGSGVVALEFTATGCGPCQRMAPVVEAMAQEYAGRVRVLQMDSDANPATTARFGVRGIPSMLLFRDGQLVDRIVGAVPAATVRARLDKVLA